MSTLPSAEMSDGSSCPDYVQLSAYQRPGEPPRVEIEPGELPTTVLTVAEAHQLIRALQLQCHHMHLDPADTGNKLCGAASTASQPPD